MEILIVVPRYNITTKANYDYLFPLGLAYISSTLKKAGYSVSCFNMNHLDGKTSNLLQAELDRKKYDFVCTGGNALGYSALKLIVDTAHQHRTKPVVIVGGPVITSEPELMMKSLNPDFGVISEGEETILDLVKAIIKKSDFSKVYGLIYFDSEHKLRVTKPRAPIKNIEALPLPDHDGFGFSKQLDNAYCNNLYINNSQNYPRPYSILGSRGCPFNCTFCWHDLKYRARSIKNIMRELEINVKKYKINNVTFFDDCFSVDPKRVYEFCKAMKKLSAEAGYTIYWTCSLMASSADKKLLETMHDAGCFAISYGFESYSPAVLRSMKKPVTPAQIDNALKLTINAQIGLACNFIFGDPAETKETAKETLDYWKKHCKGQIGLGFIQPYPGSEIYKYCLKKGIIKDKLSYIQNEMGSNNVVKMTDNFTDEEFQNLRKNLLDAFAKHIRFVKPSLIKKMGPQRYEVVVRCPFCGKIMNYKNCFAKNQWSFGFFLICKHCRMCFFVASTIQRIAYRNYSKVRALRTAYLRLRNKIKRNFF